MNTSQQITVFGANGRVGQQVVRQLLERGYTVIAAVHGTAEFPVDHTQLSVVSVDIYDAPSVDHALKGSHMIISTLGSWGTKRQDVLTVGMTHIIAAMQQQGIDRIISLTGAEARAPGDTLGVIHRLMHAGLSLGAGKILRDGERHIELLSASNLDWTVVRSPIMSADARLGAGQLSSHRPQPWQRIGRGRVVESIVGLIDNTAWRQKAPYIT